MIPAIKRAFEKPELWLVRAILLASTIAVVYYSGNKAKDTPTWLILVCIGLAAVGFHYIGAKKACAAWFDRSLPRFFAWGLVIAGAVLWEVNGQLGVGSQNQSNLTEARATAHNSSQIAQRRLASAEEKLANLTSERAWKATDLKPADAYNPDIERARSHRLFTASNGCTEVKGQQSRQHCDAFRKAESDRAMAIRRAQLGDEIKAAEADVATARDAVGKAGVTSGSTRADFKNLHRLTNLNNDDLELGQSLLMVLVMALFLTVAGWLIKAEEFEGKPRTPWVDWAGLRARLNGEPAPQPNVSRGTPIEPIRLVEKIDDASWAKAVMNAQKVA